MGNALCALSVAPRTLSVAPTDSAHAPSKRARLQCSLAPTTAQARSLSLLLIATRLAICCCEPAAATRRPSRPPGRPRLESCCRTQHGRRRPAPVLSAPALSACRAGFHRQHRRPSLLPVDRGDRQDPGVPQKWCRSWCGLLSSSACVEEASPRSRTSLGGLT